MTDAYEPFRMAAHEQKQRISVRGLRDMAEKRTGFGPNAPSTALASDVLALVEAVEADLEYDRAWDTGDPERIQQAVGRKAAARARFDFGEKT